jgi:protein-tyrosine-phosphatase
MLRTCHHHHRRRNRQPLLLKGQTMSLYNVLFLCTGNSARSIMAEAILNQLGGGRFRGYSAGSHPAGQVNPHALELLERNRYRTDGLRSKNWDEFARPDAPPMNFVLTVCDKAAGEVCPLWPGQPMSAHWGVSDPAEVRGDEETVKRAFADTFMILSRRIALLVNLPLDKLDRLALQSELRNIGKTTV